MLTLVLLASLTQTYEPDFYFMMAQENFVIDQLPKPVGYMTYIPAELAENVKLWEDDCWRCRKQANAKIISMGPDVIRWLFWPLRARDVRTSLHAEAMIESLIRCGACGGSGRCDGYIQAAPDEYTCLVCGSLRYSHAFRSDECVHCEGRGAFSTYKGEPVSR
jgi:hypothetical protein